MMTLFSCKAPEAMVYHPGIKLEKAPIMIDKKVEVRKFKDSRNDALKKFRDSYMARIRRSKNPKVQEIDTARLGFFNMQSITRLPHFYGDFSTDVTDAIIKDFDENDVFQKAGKDIEGPDYILVGEILEFDGKMTTTTFSTIMGVIPTGIITWFFGIPFHKQKSSINIKLDFYTPEGAFVSSYTAQATGIRRKSIYSWGRFLKGLPDGTNRTFSKAILNVRQQLINGTW